jgi:hypothetical protein
MSEALPLRLAMYKKWPTNCLLLAVVVRLELTGPTSLYAEGQRLGLEFLDQGITGGSCAATQLLSAPGLTLYATSKPSIGSWTKIPTTLTRLASR